MGKAINIKPAEILTFNLYNEDGELINKIDTKFTVRAQMIVDEEFGGFFKLLKQADEKPYECGAKLIYAGAKVCKPDITYEEAMTVTLDLDNDQISTVFDFAIMCFGKMNKKELDKHKADIKKKKNYHPKKRKKRK